MTPNEIVKKFERWMEVRQQLAKVKEEELELRIILAQSYFPDAPDEGTRTLKFEDGWKLQLVNKVNRALENKRGETEAVQAQLPPEVAGNVFSWSPKLKLRGYRDLTDEQRALVDSVLTTKTGTPSLDLIPPKSE